MLWQVEQRAENSVAAVAGISEADDRTGGAGVGPAVGGAVGEAGFSAGTAARLLDEPPRAPAINHAIADRASRVRERCRPEVLPQEEEEEEEEEEDGFDLRTAAVVLDEFSGTVRIPLCKQGTSESGCSMGGLRGRFAPPRR
jgi:hypothetical protein